MAVFTNWAGNVRFEPRRVVEPGPASASSATERIAELDRRTELVANAVRDATLRGRHVRALGSAWSFSGVVEARDVLISTATLSQIVDTTASSGPLTAALASPGDFAFVEAGVKLRPLFTALKQVGLTVRTAGSSSGQAIAGVVSTSTHGADFDRAPLPDAVRALLVVSPAGERLWIEPASRPLTSSDAAAKKLFKRGAVRRDDELFEAALVAVGAMGVICALVLELVPLYGLSEEVTATTWSQVRPTLSEASPTAFGPTPPGTAHPSPGAGPSEYGYLEVILNPYRTSDDYAAPAGDRAVVLCTRVRAPQFPGASWQRGTPSLLDGLGTLWAVVAGGAPDFRAQIDTLVAAGRKSSGGFHPAPDVFDTGDAPTTRVWSAEACLRTRHDAHLEFLDALLARFDALFAAGHKLAGFLSIRFTQGTRASLGMQNGPTGPSGRYCHVELFALQHPVAIGGWDPRRLAAQSERFLHAYWEEVAARADDGRAVLHWGQQGRSALDFAARTARFPKLSTHYAKAREIAGPEAFACANDFTVRAGALPLDDGWRLVATAVPRAKSDAPFDCSALAAGGPVALDLDVLTVHGDAFVAISTRRGPWVPCLQPLEIVDATDAIAGAIDVVRNEDGRPEIFARGRDGRHYHRWRTSSILGHTATWSPWTPLDGSPRFAFDPAAARDGEGKLHVVAVSTQGGIEARNQRDANGQLGWTGWVTQSPPPSGTPAGRPALVRRADGKLVCFVRDDAGRVWTSVRDGAWGPWSQTGIASAGGDPAAAASAAGVLVVVPRSTGGLEAAWVDGGVGQSGKSSTGGPAPRPGTRLAVAPVGAAFLVALTDADGRVVPFLHGGPADWRAPLAPIPASAVSSPTMTAIGSARARLYVKIAHDMVQTRVLRW